MALYYKPLSILLSTLLVLFASKSFSEAKKNGGITVDLIHRDSSLSPSYDPTNTHFERLRSSFHRSFSRKSSIKSASLWSTSKSVDSIEADITPIGGEYLMKIQIGTPPVDVLAIADTGSDLTWTQCEPCTKCYSQNAPLFDPIKTTTYRTVSCASPQCKATGGGASCDTTSNDCNYQVNYGDNSYSRGDLAVETFTFGSTSEGSATFPKVVFGCGHANGGTFNGTGSGIIGLGGGSVSIIRQLEKSIGGKFSYCLTYLDTNASSKISFGSDAIVSGPKVISTPLIAKDPSTFYYITLEGISVGNERFEYKSVPQSDYDYNTNDGGGEGNIIIDSGTTLTFVPSTFYSGVESSLVNSIEGNRVTDPQGTFGLCYELPSDGQFKSPSITVHFTGADVVLPQGSIFLEVEKGVVCLTLLPSDDMAIFGNLHQINYHIGYDLENGKLNFLPTDCSNAQ